MMLLLCGCMCVGAGTATLSTDPRCPMQPCVLIAKTYDSQVEFAASGQTFGFG